MTSDKVQILDQVSIMARLKRMAYEIYESNYGAKKLMLIGIDERGTFLAEKLAEFLKEISSLKISMLDAQLDREAEEGLGITLSGEVKKLKGRRVIVVDDVLYSGNTMMQVVSILVQLQPASIQTAVLIDRGHRAMPISSDFVGLELATTLQQHVYFDKGKGKKKMQAYIM
ncbi:MAG: phosphoribosyltransferase family protein [Bacteroidota bacterium]